MYGIISKKEYQKEFYRICVIINDERLNSIFNCLIVGNATESYKGYSLQCWMRKSYFITRAIHSLLAGLIFLGSALLKTDVQEGFMNLIFKKRNVIRYWVTFGQLNFHFLPA